jgi:hypothetical protein
MSSRRALQTILEAPHGNALQACVATVLNLPLESVPNFVAAEDSWAAMQEHAASLGMGLLKLSLKEDGTLHFATRAGSLCIVRGASPRGGHGQVVVASVGGDGLSLEHLHDPYPEGGGLLGPAAWAAFWTSPQPVAPAAVSADALAARLAPPLRAAGFDLIAPFAADWYNEEPHIAKHEGPQHKLDAAAGSLAFIVGNSRALWRPFVQWAVPYMDTLGDESRPDVLDEYTRRTVKRVLSAPGLPPCQVYWAFETGDSAVSVTTAASVAGLAFYHPEHQRSVHATLGPWIAYRAILVFDSVDASALPKPPPPTDPCTAAEWARVGALQAACFAQWSEDPNGSEEDWGRLVEVVRAFETGRAHAYSDQMVAFHYTVDVSRRLRGLREAATVEPPSRCAL